MSGPRGPSPDQLAELVTGRRDSLFAAEVAAHAAAVRAAVAGRRVLVVGGAGSLGSATIAALLPEQPAALAVVDHDENALVELVRDLRHGDRLLPPLQPMALDFGSPWFAQWLAGEPPFDLVLNFAAQKHVRSARDRSSLLQLLDTNLGKAERLLACLRARGGCSRFFCVSTDKAADPVNAMGASKRLMEQLVFRDGALPGAVVTSARFANVAFSAGSLLAGFLLRLAKRQPLAVPLATRRWLLTPVEAGQLCLLAATVAPHRHVLVPRLDPAQEVLLEHCADAVVAAHGYSPQRHCDERTAKAALPDDLASGRWPILGTARDTDGEKERECFVGAGERVVDVGPRLQAIAAAPADAAPLLALLAELDAEARAVAPRLRFDDLLQRLAALLPTFAPRVTGRRLDDRM